MADSGSPGPLICQGGPCSLPSCHWVGVGGGQSWLATHLRRDVGLETLGWEDVGSVRAEWR